MVGQLALLPVERHVCRSRSEEGAHICATTFLEVFLAGRTADTVRAYRADLVDFASFLGVADPAIAVDELLASHARANLLALQYRAHLIERGLAPATINRRLSALRSVVKVARTIGLVTFTIDTPNVPSRPYRDTRGPGRAGVRAMLEVAASRKDAKGARDVALLHLLYDLGLRRAEVVELDLEHWQPFPMPTISVRGKGQRERITLTMPPATAEALARWLEYRGDAPGALFTSMDRTGKGDGRLTGRGLHAVIRSLGAAAGLRTWPHAIRHAAITTALDMTNGDVRAVQRFSRHADVRTVGRYDDNRTDLGGQVAALIAM